MRFMSLVYTWGQVDVDVVRNDYQLDKRQVYGEKRKKKKKGAVWSRKSRKGRTQNKRKKKRRLIVCFRSLQWNKLRKGLMWGAKWRQLNFSMGLNSEIAIKRNISWQHEALTQPFSTLSLKVKTEVSHTHTDRNTHTRTHTHTHTHTHTQTSTPWMKSRLFQHLNKFKISNKMQSSLPRQPKMRDLWL